MLKAGLAPSYTGISRVIAKSPTSNRISALPLFRRMLNLISASFPRPDPLQRIGPFRQLHCGTFPRAEIKVGTGVGRVGKSSHHYVPSGVLLLNTSSIRLDITESLESSPRRHCCIFFLSTRAARRTAAMLILSPRNSLSRSSRVSALGTSTLTLALVATEKPLGVTLFTRLLRRFGLLLRFLKLLDASRFIASDRQ
jgi:hypothetical protein